MPVNDKKPKKDNTGGILDILQREVPKPPKKEEDEDDEYKVVEPEAMA